MIVIFEGHFYVETDKFTEMTMRVRVLGAKNGTYRKHLKIQTMNISITMSENCRDGDGEKRLRKREQGATWVT